MTTSPAHPPVAGAEESLSSRNGQQRSTAPARGATSPATAALAAYLDAVAAAMNRRGIAVAEVQTSTAGQISGRIQLARQRTRRPRAAIELRWSESTGWEAALRPIRGQPATPWRFLHADLTPQPDYVASFTHGLLRGEDLGMAYPATFRATGTNLADLIARLARAEGR